MDSIYRIHPEKFYCFHLKYTTAAYYRAMGNWNRMYWNKALQLYEELRQEYTVNKQSAYYRWITQETIYLYKIQGKSMAACLLYQELYSTVDTLTAEGYVRQINILRAKYQIDQMEIASREEHNKFITDILTGSILLVFIFIIIAIMLRKQRQEIALSTQKLEHLRTNAENATSAKSIFLSNMSHEIRTPLNSIVGFSSLLAETDDREERQEYIKIVETNNELLLQLVSDILDLSKIESGTFDFVRSDLDVNESCMKIIKSLEMKVPETVDLVFEKYMPDCHIYTDKNRFMQVITNFINNALKFTKQGTIALGYEQTAPHEIKFYVRDTGFGIPKEKIDSIFERFVKLNTFVQGTGLGLSICKSLVSQMGGKIGVESTEGEGSCFWFTHPY